MTVRLEVLGDDGEWQEVPGIASVRFESSQFDFGEAAREEARSLRVIDQDGPVRPRADRPAWQSPYGPQQRRR